MRYQIEVHKAVVEDNYQHGEMGKTSDYGSIITLHAETLRDVPRTVAEFLCCDTDELRAYENRIEWSTLETGEGYQPTENLKALWQEGQCKLYSASYSCFVTEVWSKEITTGQLMEVGVQKYED